MGKGHLSNHVYHWKLPELRDIWATFIYSFVNNIGEGLDRPAMF